MSNQVRPFHPPVATVEMATFSRMYNLLAAIWGVIRPSQTAPSLLRYRRLDFLLGRRGMQFGFGAPVSGPLSMPDNLARIAAEGEAMGYDYATISDHVVIPRDIEAKYPYSDTGEFPGRSRGDRHEPLIAVACVAGTTSRLRLVTSVTVVPHRPAVLQAK